MLLPSGLQALFEILEEPGAVSSPLLIQVRAELAALRDNEAVQRIFAQEGLLTSQVSSFPTGIIGDQLIAFSVGAGDSCKICGRTIAGVAAQIVHAEWRGQSG